MCEQTLGVIPLDLGLVVEDKHVCMSLSIFNSVSCTCIHLCMLELCACFSLGMALNYGP